MKRVMTVVVLLSVLAGFTLNASAAEMKTVVMFNFNTETYGTPMIKAAISALSQAGWKEGEQMRIVRIEPKQEADILPQIQAAKPDIVISLGWAFNYEIFRQFPCPVITFNEAEVFVDANGAPTANVTGVYTKLKDLVYNSMKFLQKVAPLKPGQQVVVLYNRLTPRISKEETLEALQRLNIPVKAVIDTTVYEDWQEALLKYNDDPEVGWIQTTIAPTQKRDGSVPDLYGEVIPWNRDIQKKPNITYWENVVLAGWLCCFGVELEDIGTICGEMAARILNGEDVNTITAEYPRKTTVALNRKTADVMGIIFPPDVLNLANVIYHDWEGKEVTRKSGLK